MKKIKKAKKIIARPVDAIDSIEILQACYQMATIKAGDTVRRFYPHGTVDYVVNWCELRSGKFPAIIGTDQWGDMVSMMGEDFNLLSHK